MIAKIKFSVPHLLDHLIIQKHIRDSHWFSAYMDVNSRYISFLDSSQAYSTANSHGRKCFCGISTEWHGQSLGQQTDVTVDNITTTVDDCIVAKWKRRGVCPWPAGD